MTTATVEQETNYLTELDIDLSELPGLWNAEELEALKEGLAEYRAGTSIWQMAFNALLVVTEWFSDPYSTHDQLFKEIQIMKYIMHHPELEKYRGPCIYK